MSKVTFSRADVVKIDIQFSADDKAVLDSVFEAVCQVEKKVGRPLALQTHRGSFYLSEEEAKIAVDELNKFGFSELDSEGLQDKDVFSGSRHQGYDQRALPNKAS